MLRKYLVALGIFLAWGALQSALESRDAEITSRAVREADEKKRDVRPEELLSLMIPFECQQRITKQADGGKPRTHYVCADLTKRAQ